MSLGRALALGTFMFVVPAVAHAQCSASATPVSFGVYVPFSATATDTTGSVTVRCATVRSSPAEHASR